MTYDPRSIYQSYAQYGQNKKQNTNTKKNTTTGLGSKSYGSGRGSIVEGKDDRANANEG